MTRREVGNLKKDILFGKIPGKKGRKRFPTRWSDLIRARMGSVVRAASHAQDHDGQRAFLDAIKS